MDTGALLAEMRALRDSVAGITDTALASRDGLIIAADTLTIDPDNLAALAASALGVNQRIAAEAGHGSLRETVVTGGGGHVVTYAVGHRALLAVVGDPGLDLTRLFRESRATLGNLEQLLSGAHPSNSGHPVAAD